MSNLRPPVKGVPMTNSTMRAVSIGFDPEMLSEISRMSQKAHISFAATVRMLIVWGIRNRASDNEDRIRVNVNR